MDNFLEVSNLSKSFPSFRLQNINFSLPKGYIMGLIGPNGSGKTTTIKLGSINGRIFMYIPVVGFLAMLLLISKFDVPGNPIMAALIGNSIVSVLSLLLICVIAYVISIIVSIKIIRSKEV